MKFIRYLGVSAFAVIMAFMVMSATTVHAESGCTSQDRQIQVGEYFTLGFQCEISGDVSMRDAYGYYRRLYDDDDASTGLITKCTDLNGCAVSAEHGGYISARDAVTMTVDTFKYVPNLKWIDTKCWPTSCGVTRYFPQLTPPYYTTSGTTIPPPVYVPPTPPARQYFGTGQSVLGGTIVLSNGQTFYGCYIAYAWTSGYVDYGFVNPAYTFGYNSSCGTPPPPPAHNPCPSGGITPNCTVNGQPERSSMGIWSRFNAGEAAYGDRIIMDNNQICTIGSCYKLNPSSGGLVFNGWINPQPWRISDPISSW